MKLPFYSYILALMIALGGCANKKATDTAATVNSTQQEIIASKEADINTAERRLDAMSDNVHDRKFRGGTSDARKILNDRYADLGSAKSELKDLKNAVNDADFNDKQAKLDATLANLNAKLDGIKSAE